jgi:multicopper oxidase
MVHRRRAWQALVVALTVLAVGVAVIVITRSQPVQAINAGDPAVQAAEDQRRAAGAEVREVRLTAAPATVRIGDRDVATWAFNDQVPGPELRLPAGAVLRATVENRLPDPLTIHWHGIDLRADMDGVPELTQQPIAPGEEFTYEFTVPDPGTFFYHSHVGVQLDRGLYGPLVIDDPAEELAYDREVTVMLDDWLDGIDGTPEQMLARLLDGGMPHGAMDHGAMDHGAMGSMTDSPLGDDTGDVDYSLYLSNGRPPGDPEIVDVVPGERVRLRLVNAASDTAFRVALRDAGLTVTHTDGRPVLPFETEAILLGMGERYDVLVTLPDPGVYPLVASAEGKHGQAMTVLRTGPGELPPPDVRPAELTGRLLTLNDLEAAPTASLDDREPAQTYRMRLTGGMHAYEWGVEGEQYDGVTMPVRDGERIRLILQNDTMMWHPMHLHGQPFQVQGAGGTGPLKDTVNVPPMEEVTVDFAATNPGTWLLHCHNIYHAEAGMHTVLQYVQ